MSYQSFGFVIFSALALVLYYIVPKRKQVFVLAAANMAFYVFAGIKYLPFLLTTMLCTFFVGKKIGAIYDAADLALTECTEPKDKKEIRANAKKSAKRVLIAGLASVILLLVVCKYTVFILENINLVFAFLQIPQITVVKMILPIGISFYTFMALGYILDVYWKRYKAENNFINYAVFLSYFPHIVQGPIDRFNDFKKQIECGVQFDKANIIKGVELALWGMFKKLVIADRLGIFVDYVFGNWQKCGGITLAVTVAVYSIQIYTDFSGCIDIVRGVSECFGITLRKNFNHPYFSKTMGEFWRRWHISLQEWFKDYVYYPVSASSFLRKAKKHFKDKNQDRAMELFASCFPVLVVWLVTGIWHGAAWRFVVWGLFHATLLIGSQICEPAFIAVNNKLKINTDNFIWKLWQMTRTFILCCIGRVFFRAPYLGVSVMIFKKIFTSFSIEGMFGSDLNGMNILLATLSIAFLWLVDMIQERTSVRELVGKQNMVVRWFIVFAGLFAIILFGVYGPGYDASSFIYEQF